MKEKDGTGLLEEGARVKLKENFALAGSPEGIILSKGEEGVFNGTTGFCSVTDNGGVARKSIESALGVEFERVTAFVPVALLETV